MTNSIYTKPRRLVILPSYAGGLTALRKSLKSLQRKIREQGYPTCLIEAGSFSGFYFVIELENEELRYKFSVAVQRYGLKFGEPMSEIKLAFMKSFEEEIKN
jgi:DNA repair photolyase